MLRMWFHFTVASPGDDIRYEPDSPGGLNDVGCYCISLATYLAGGLPTAFRPPLSKGSMRRSPARWPSQMGYSRSSTAG